jgi:hypothetical protein
MPHQLTLPTSGANKNLDGTPRRTTSTEPAERGATTTTARGESERVRAEGPGGDSLAPRGLS